MANSTAHNLDTEATKFQQLGGILYIGSGTLDVMLANGAMTGRYVMADAVRLERVTYAATEAAYIHLHGGDDVVLTHAAHDAALALFGGDGVIGRSKPAIVMRVKTGHMLEQQFAK